jgi:hypothetical protein
MNTLAYADVAEEQASSSASTIASPMQQMAAAPASARRPEW